MTQPAVPTELVQAGFWARLRAAFTTRRLALIAMLLSTTAIAIGVGVLADDPEYWRVALPTYITGIGTLALAGVTVWVAITDRRRDDVRAVEARAEADKRIRDEWNFRRSEFQRSYAREMIEAVEAIKATAASIVELPMVGDHGSRNPFDAGSGLDRANRAIAHLQNVSRTSGALCGDPEIKERLARLLLLCQKIRQTVPREPGTGLVERLVGDLVTYGVYTIAGIEEWASYREITGVNAPPPFPFRGVYDRSIWTPQEVPIDWQRRIEVEPLHPQYELIRDQQL